MKWLPELIKYAVILYVIWFVIERVRTKIKEAKKNKESGKNGNV